MDSPEGSANDAMTAEIDRRVNEAVNKQFKHRISSKLAVITTRIHKGTQADALIDTGYDLYTLVDHDLARKLRLLVVDRSERVLGSFSDAIGATKVTGVVIFNLELCGYDEKIFAYTVRSLSDDLFLGKPWIEKNYILYDTTT
ncbi:pol-like protein [Colletotrichum kahawae]|uniref:Pol-like protein n=1 Tax=Colletotrichum kahawae TaxID=34407 RepID=A0AAD9Y1E0_COLKA|nr:pol-like protein [Colletotrichum kahawae]